MKKADHLSAEEQDIFRRSVWRAIRGKKKKNQKKKPKRPDLQLQMNANFTLCPLDV